MDISDKFMNITMDEANLGGSTDYEQANERRADWSACARCMKYEMI